MAKRYLVVTFSDADEAAVRGAVESVLTPMGIEHSVTCNAHEPLQSDRADPAIADRLAAIDLLVQQHPACKPGGSMLEHAQAVVDKHDWHVALLADQNSVLGAVEAGALISAHKIVAVRKQKNAALIAEADAQRASHAAATVALASKLRRD